MSKGVNCLLSLAIGCSYLVACCLAAPASSLDSTAAQYLKTPSPADNRRVLSASQSGTPHQSSSSHSTFNQSWLTCWQLTTGSAAGNSSGRHGDASRPQKAGASAVKRVMVLRQPLNNHFQEISTPRFPHPYPGDYECSWSFSVPPGHRYRLLITHAEFEEASEQEQDVHCGQVGGSSHVTITELHKRPTVLRKFCSRNNTRSHFIRGRYEWAPIVHISFRSNGQTNHTASGFRAVFYSYPRHAMFPLTMHKSSRRALRQLRKQNCGTRSSCTQKLKQHDIYYYSPGEVKTLLREVLSDRTRNLSSHASHPCSNHPLLIALSASSNITSSGWVSNHPCDHLRRNA